MPIVKEACGEEDSPEPALAVPLPSTPSISQPPQRSTLRPDVKLKRERHHDGHGQGHLPDGPGRSRSDESHTHRQQRRDQERGRKEIPSSSSTVSGTPSRWPEQAADDGLRKQQRGARKSLVDRQAESLGWSAETQRRASTERARRASDGSSHRPSRGDSSRQNSGELPRRSASAAAAAMPRSSFSSSSSSSSSGAGFFGSFDDSRYWDFAFRFTQRQDIGNQCRECKRPFLVLDEEIAVRRGGRIELRYHKDCFSMIADPRSQPASSANVGKFVQSLEGTVAPNELYRKMRTRGHW